MSQMVVVGSGLVVPQQYLVVLSMYEYNRLAMIKKMNINTVIVLSHRVLAVIFESLLVWQRAMVLSVLMIAGARIALMGCLAIQSLT